MNKKVQHFSRLRNKIVYYYYFVGHVFVLCFISAVTTAAHRFIFGLGVYNFIIGIINFTLIRVKELCYEYVNSIGQQEKLFVDYLV